MKKIFTRFGDSFGVWMTEAEIKNDLRTGMEDAASRGHIPELTEDDLSYLFEICAIPTKVTSVERGKEVITTFDAGTLKLPVRCGIPVDRSTAILIHERVLCSDTMELAHVDYSYKQIKTIIAEETAEMEKVQMNTIIPIFYGAMPNLGLYTKPNGPIDSWVELLPQMKIKEARQAQEEAIELAVSDMVYVGSKMYESGADGINFDTVGASGDTDMLAALKACEILKKKYPNIAIEFGMAGEFVLGMHGELKYGDDLLAGLYPHKQVKVAERAGASIFGVAINTNTSMSFPWNLGRVVTYVKACTEAANIPVHVNVGMGVGSIPVSNTAPVDIISRADKALIEVGKADGL